MDFTLDNPKILRVKERKKEKLIYEKTRKEISVKDNKRIEKLKIPKVYKTIWLSKSIKRPLQAIAVDTKGKKQYYYTESHKDSQKTKKIERICKLIKVIPKLRKKIEKDKLSKDKRTVIRAYLVDILIHTGIRIGNKKYLDKYESVGLTTLQKKHLKFDKGVVTIKFKGKHNIKNVYRVYNKSIIKFLKGIKTDWISDYGTGKVSAQDVNNYLHEIIPDKSGENFVAKDFRTLLANQIYFCTNGDLEKVADVLGNNKETCKNNYVFTDMNLSEKTLHKSLIKFLG